MNRERLVNASERWFRLLQRLYPVDFRDDMGDAVVNTYRDRAREALHRGGILRLAAVWVRALLDSLRNGPGERARPAASWRRSGNWGRDGELAVRRLLRAPAFVAATAGTLTIGLALVAVVYTVVHKILIEPMPYRDSGDLYYVWRDYTSTIDMKRGALNGTDIVELRTSTSVIEDVAGFTPFLGGIFALREGADPSEIAVTVVSPNLFEMLGVAPALGRGFARNEVGPGRPNVIMLTHQLWSRFGADPAIVGQQVRLNAQSYTVVGIIVRRLVTQLFPTGDPLGARIPASGPPSTPGGVPRDASLTIVGVLIGLPAIYAAGGMIRDILVGISPTDPLTLAVVALGLGVVTMLACYVPARRVTRIDPALALRQE